MHEHKIHSMLFSAKYLDMLVITERLELDTDSIFLKSTWPPVLQPDSLLLVFWEGFMIICIVYACFSIPYYSLYIVQVPMLIRASFILISFLWILDIFIQLLTAVKTKDELVTTIPSIFSHRLHSFGFCVDIIACIPIEIFSRLVEN